MHIIMCHWHEKRHFPLAALVLRTCHHARNTLSKAPILYTQFCSEYALLCLLYQARLHSLEIEPCRAVFIFAISLREKCTHVFVHLQTSGMSMQSVEMALEVFSVFMVAVECSAIFIFTGSLGEKCKHLLVGS